MLIESDITISLRQKNILKDTLELVNKCRNIYRAREEFTGTKATFKMIYKD
jgi:hypothetical protein